MHHPLLSRRAARIAAALVSLLITLPAFATGENITGAWDPNVYNWPLIPLHAVLMPDGRVMTYGTDGTGKQTGFFIYDVWDINSGFGPGSHLTLPNLTNTDIFCGSQLMLPQGGTVFLAGGDNWTGTATTNTGNPNSNLFTLSDNSLKRGADMNRARWYSTSTVLLNGEILIQGGTGGTDHPEVRAVDGTFRVLTGADTSPLDFAYPRNFIARNGTVFGYDSNGLMYFINPAGTGAILFRPQLPAANRGSDASAAMFQPGRILQFGGSSNGAVIIDITQAGLPRVTPTGSMSSQRRLVNATVLPDGRVLATGGSSVWNEPTDVNNSAEIWDPGTGVWTRGPDGQRARLYHSIAMLLPNASVGVGGGGAPGPQNNTNLEIYNPPYLYDSTGARAVQPLLTSAPAELNIGQVFDVEFTNAASISRVTMVKTGSVTHSFNMEQRFVELTTFKRNGSRLRIQAPVRAADAPPGFWMIFALNETGVPSVARIVKVNVAPVPNPATAPRLVNPGNRRTKVGIPVSLALSASDPNGDALTYAASGLPTGLTIDTATGLISGTPRVVGVFNLIVSASDGFNSASQTSTWTVKLSNTAPTLVNPGDQVTSVGNPASLQPSATDPDGDPLTYAATGLPPGLTINTATGLISGTPTAAGAFSVTVSTSDGIDNAVQSFTWTVNPPNTAPTLVNPGTRIAFVGIPILLQLRATDPDGDELTYAAAGLPPGLTIDTATGLISGTPTAAGAFFAVAQASGGINRALALFFWSIRP